MVIKGGRSKMVDLRRAPKDIVQSVKNSGRLGGKLNSLERVRNKLTDFLRKKIPNK